MPEWFKGIGDQAAAVIVFSYIIIKELIFKLTQLKNGKSDKERNYEELKKDIKDLWEWHNKEDSDGIKTWYVSHTLKEKIGGMENDIREIKNNLKK